MLTAEVLKANDSLKGLTDEQIATIATLSENDENTVIAKKTREIWDSVDADIETVTGEVKPSSTKSYDHLKSVLSGLKNKADDSDSTELKTVNTTLKTENANLKKQIKEGVKDPAVKLQITTLEKENKDLKTANEALRGDIKKKDKDHANEIKKEKGKNVELKFETAKASALAGIKFKAGIEDDTRDAMIQVAHERAMGTGTPEFQDDNTIHFRDEKEFKVRNVDNLQNPITYKEAFIKHLGSIVDNGRSQKGGGTNEGGGNNQNGTLDLSGVKTKVEANKAIGKYLAAKGIVKGTQEFADERNKLYEENKISELPTQ